jgi:hypothetical protein
MGRDGELWRARVGSFENIPTRTASRSSLPMKGRENHQWLSSSEAPSAER